MKEETKGVEDGQQSHEADKTNKKVRDLRMKSLEGDHVKNVKAGVRVVLPPRRDPSDSDIKKKSASVDHIGLGDWG